MSILPPIRCVVVESPFAANQARTKQQHRAYLFAAMADCIRRGESPIASHHWLPEILNDDGPYERQLGIRLGIAWGERADAIGIYSQLGVSSGMRQAISEYKARGKVIEWRSIDDRIVRDILATA